MTYQGFGGRSARVLTTALALALSSTALPAIAAATGEIVTINWLGGAQGEMWTKLQEDFVAKNPEVSFRDIVPQATGDARGGIRQIILGGEQADILINTWPAFRKELADAGLILPVDDIWEEGNVSEKLGDSWKALSTIDGTNYGITYTFGDRSGIWYQNSTLETAGIRSAGDLGRIHWWFRRPECGRNHADLRARQGLGPCGVV